MVRLSGTFTREGASGSSSSKTAQSATFAPSAIGDSPQRAFKSLPLWFKDSSGGPAPDSAPAKSKTPLSTSAAVMAAGPSSSSSSSGLTGWVRTRKNSKGAAAVLDQAADRSAEGEAAGPRSRGASQDLRASAKSPDFANSSGSGALGRLRKGEASQSSGGGSGSGLSRFFSGRRKANHASSDASSSIVSPTRKQAPRLDDKPAPIAKHSPPVAIISSAYSEGKFSPRLQSEAKEGVEPAATEKPLPSPKPSASSSRARRQPPLGAADADGAAFEFPIRPAMQQAEAVKERRGDEVPAAGTQDEADGVQYATRVPRPAHAEHTSSHSAPLLMPSSYASSSDDPISFVYNPTRVHSPDEEHSSTAQAASSAAIESSRRPPERKRNNSLADRLTMFLAGGSASTPKHQQETSASSSGKQPSTRRPQTADSFMRSADEPLPSGGGSFGARREESSGSSLRRRPSQLLLLGNSRKEEGVDASATGTSSSAPAATTKRKLSLRRLKPSIFSSAASPPTTPEIHSWRTPPLDKHPAATATHDDVQVVSSASAARPHTISRVPVPRLETPDYSDSFGDPRAMLREAGIASRASTVAHDATLRSTTPGAEGLLENMPRSEESDSAANESSEIQGLGLITGEEDKGFAMAATTATATLLQRSGSLSAGRRRKESREGKEVVGEVAEAKVKARGGTRDTQDTAVSSSGGGGGSSSTGTGDSSSDTKLAGPRSPSRPYSLISADGTDTPILRLRKLVVDTDEPAEGAAASEAFFFRPPGSGSNVSSVRSGRGSGGRDSSEGGSSPDLESKDKAALAAQAAGAAASASAATARPSKERSSPPATADVDSPGLPSESSSKDAPSVRSRKPMPRLSSDAASSRNRDSDSQDSKRMSQDNISRRASQASWTAPGAAASRFSMVTGPRIRASLQVSEAGTAVTAGSDGMSALEAEVGQARRLDVAPAVMERVKVEEWTRTFGRRGGRGATLPEEPQEPIEEPPKVEEPPHPRRASASSREPSSGSGSGSVGASGAITTDALPKIPDEGPVAPPGGFHDSWHPFNPQLSEDVLASSPPRSRSHPQNLTMASTPVNPPSPNTAAADEAARLGKAPAKRVRRSQSQPLRPKRSEKSPGQTSGAAGKHSSSSKTGTSRSSRSKVRGDVSLVPNPDSSPEASPQAFRNVLRPSQSGNLRERTERERGAGDDASTPANVVATASAPPRKSRSSNKLRREGTEQSTASSAVAPSTPADYASPSSLRRKPSERAMSALSPQTVSSPQAGGSTTTASGSQGHAQQRPKPTYATSEEAALAKRREAAERERRHRQRQERKDAERQAAYARRKKSDPLLAARLALVGLMEISPDEEPVPHIPGFVPVPTSRKREGRADEESPAASEAQHAPASKLLSVEDPSRSALHSGRLSDRAESTISFATALEEEQATTDRLPRSRQQSGSSVPGGPGAGASSASEPAAVVASVASPTTSPAPRGTAHSRSSSFESARRRVMTPEVVVRASHGNDRPATASSLVTVDSATTLAALDFPVPPHRSRIAQTSDDGTILARGKLEDWESPRPLSVVSRSSIVEPPRFVETVHEEEEYESQGDATLRPGVAASAIPQRVLEEEEVEEARSLTPTSSVMRGAPSTFVEAPSSTTSSKLTIHGITRPLSNGQLRESPTKARLPELVGASPVVSDSASVAALQTPDLESEMSSGREA